MSKAQKLMDAVENNEYTTLNSELGSGFSQLGPVNPFSDEEQALALKAATKKGSLEAAKILISHGAPIHQKCGDDNKSAFEISQENAAHHPQVSELFKQENFYQKAMKGTMFGIGSAAVIGAITACYFVYKFDEGRNNLSAETAELMFYSIFLAFVAALPLVGAGYLLNKKLLAPDLKVQLPEAHSMDPAKQKED